MAQTIFIATCLYCHKTFTPPGRRAVPPYPWCSDVCKAAAKAKAAAGDIWELVKRQSRLKGIVSEE